MRSKPKLRRKINKMTVSSEQMNIDPFCKIERNIGRWNVKNIKESIVIKYCETRSFDQRGK